MDKKQAVNILAEIAVLLELKDENPFRIRAYQNAARALEASSVSLDSNTTPQQLTQIKGIGSRIAEQILALVKNGSLDLYKELTSSTPQGLVDMLKIPSLGPKKIKYIYDELNIDNILELELACQENRLAGLPNFGPRTQENILRGIKLVKKYSGSFLYADVYEQAHQVLEDIRSCSQVKRADIAGSMRRKKEIIKDVDIVAATDQPQKVMDFFTSLKQAAEIIARGDTKSSIKLDSGINADIRAVTSRQYPYALHHFTGSKEHNTAMRSMSKKMGIKINEYGLFKDGKLIECENEHDFFNIFSMDYIPPELRENYGEIDAARNRSLPTLVRGED
ncbi:MAG: helix-hairpin-helix domain-containing protein, partial [Actinomycetota bacterium]